MTGNNQKAPIKKSLFNKKKNNTGGIKNKLSETKNVKKDINENKKQQQQKANNMKKWKLIWMKIVYFKIFQI